MNTNIISKYIIIILHHASMKYYYDYLKFYKSSVKYIHYNKKFNITNYTLFNPIDKIKLFGKFTIIKSPNFLLNKKLYAKYRNKTKNFFLIHPTCGLKRT